MRGILILMAAMLVTAFGLQAQQGAPGADVWVSAHTYPSKIEGCLQLNGFYYRVLSKDGTAYNLVRRTTALTQFIGHEVEITGKPTVISLDTTQIDAASTVEEFPALEVNAVKELSDTCTSVSH